MAAPAKRFELPVLDLKLGSLTEGTDIPPPLPSPVLEQRPKTPPKETKEARNGAARANGAGATESPQSIVSTNGVKRSADDVPVSPTGSNRQGSIRRLFSRNLLNAAYNDSESVVHTGLESRPTSRSNVSVLDDKRSKRSSGWFRRLRGEHPATTTAGDKRSSRVFDDVKKPVGPPPPMIPELSSWSKVDLHDDGSLGNDLFKNIK
jgi:hypothetical protein